MTIRDVNGVPVSDHMVQRLRDVGVRGGARTGCRNCRNLTFDRLVDAGLLEVTLPGVYAITMAGVEFLRGEGGA